MFCTSCGKQLNDQAVVCPSCGCSLRAVKKFCWNCGNGVNDPQAVACTSCGVSLLSPAPIASSSLSGAKPGKVQAMAIITLISGCINAMVCLLSFFYIILFGLGTFGIGCIFLPLCILPLVAAIMELIYSLNILPTPMKTNKTSLFVPILEIACIIMCNPISLAAGILNLVFGSDPEVKAYFDAQQPR